MAQTDYALIDLSAWKQVGEGGNGKTYANPDRPEAILKVNNGRLSTLEAVKHEFETSKAVEALGIAVPKVYEIVRVGHAYATVSQIIHGKKSLSRICHDQPERTEEMAQLLSQKGKEFHSTPCNTDSFPNRKEQALQAIDQIDFISKKNRVIVRKFIETIPDVTTCLHGDFQTGNLIESGGQLYWIDLDRFAYGDPMFDIGHLYQICKVYYKMKKVQDIFHMTEEQLGRFWEAFATDYTGQKDHADFDRLAGKFACLDIVTRAFIVPTSTAEKVFFWFQVRKLVKEYYL